MIFTHNWTGDGMDEPVYALHVLDTMGVRKDAYLATGAAAYLYELRPAPASDATPLLSPPKPARK